MELGNWIQSNIGLWIASQPDSVQRINSRAQAYKKLLLTFNMSFKKFKGSKMKGSILFDSGRFGLDYMWKSREI